MVSKKSKRKKKIGTKTKKGGGSVPQGTIFMDGSREANEAKWDEISSNLSRILQGQVIIYSANISIKFLIVLVPILKSY